MTENNCSFLYELNPIRRDQKQQAYPPRYSKWVRLDCVGLWHLVINHNKVPQLHTTQSELLDYRASVVSKKKML